MAQAASLCHPALSKSSLIVLIRPYSTKVLFTLLRTKIKFSSPQKLREVCQIRIGAFHRELRVLERACPEVWLNGRRT